MIIENRPDEAFFRKLDSNLKKNTAFVKKLVCIVYINYKDLNRVEKYFDIRNN